MALEGQLRLVWDNSDDAGPAVEVSLTGEFDLATVGQLTDTLFAPEVISAARVRVDLAAVSFLETSTVHTLVAAAARVRHAGGTFTVSCDKQTITWRVFEILQVADYLVGEPTSTLESESELVQRSRVTWWRDLHAPMKPPSVRTTRLPVAEASKSEPNGSDRRATLGQEHQFSRPTEMTLSGGR